MLEPEPLLSESIVIPTLDSMLGGHTLKLLHLPKKFRVNISEQMNLFLQRYNEYLSSFQFKCSKCRTFCEETGSTVWVFRYQPGIIPSYLGTQNYTCSQCLEHFCFGDCKDDNGDDYIEWCDGCETHYCQECVPTKECDECSNHYCNKCDALDRPLGRCQTCHEHKCNSDSSSGYL